MLTVEIYKPHVEENKPLSLDKEEISYASKLFEASKNGSIKVKLEEDVVVRRISHDLYSNPGSGIREFYANEVRACRLAARNYGAKPRIVITLSPLERRLTIHGIDSLGISQEKFLQIYSVLGRSDNFDPHEVGQWGFGRGAYTTLSDAMVLETYSREDGSRYAVLGRNGTEYNILPEPQMESYGTKVSLTIRNHIDLNDLVTYIEECAALSGVETYLVLTEDLRNSWSDAIIKEKGTYILNKTVDDILKQEEIDDQKVIVEIDDEDFYLKGYLAVDTTYRLVSMKNTKHVFLIGIPISSDIEVPLTAFVLNIKDERKYPPTADRERLTEKAEDDLEEKIIHSIRERIPALNIRTVDEYLSLSEKERVIVERNPGGLLSEGTKSLSEFLNLPIKRVSEKEGRLFYDSDKMYEAVVLAAGTDNIFYRQNHTAAKIRAIKEVKPNAIFVKLRKGELGNMETAISMMRTYGIQFVDDFIDANNIQIRKLAPKCHNVVVHRSYITYYSWGRFARTASHSTLVPVNMLDDKVLAIPKGRMKQFVKLVGSFKTTYTVTRERLSLKGPKPFEQFVKECQAKTIITSEGEMKVSDLVSHEKEIKLHLYSDPAIAKYYFDPMNTHVFGDDDLLFEIAAVLTFYERNYTLDTDGRDEFSKFGQFLTESFIDDPYYSKVGDSEILFSIVHIERAIKDKRLKELFLNAARHLKDASGIRRMREYALELNNELLRAQQSA